MMAWLRKHNVPQKALALLGAVVLWLFVIEVVDPPGQQSTVVVPIVFEGEDSVRGRDLVVTSDIAQSVPVTFTGNFKIVSAIARNPGEYGEVYFDFSSQVTGALDGRRQPRWRWYDNNQPEKADAPKVGSFHLKVERLIEAPIPVRLRLSGVPEHYQIEAAVPDPATIVVEGPESAVGRISEAWVEYDVSNIRESMTTETAFFFVDAAGERLEMGDEAVRYTDKRVRISLSVSHDKQVNLRVDKINYGFLPEDAVSITIDPTSIGIAGEPDVVEGINHISLGEINIMAFLESDADYARGYLLRSIELENGIKSDAAGSQASIYIAFPGYARQKLTFDQRALPQSTAFEYPEQTFQLTAFGPDSGQGDLLKAENLVVTFDSDPGGLEPGEHEVEASVSSSLENVRVLGGRIRVRVMVLEPSGGEPPTGID